MSADLLRRAAAKIRENAEATVVIEARTGEVIPWHTASGLERDWDQADAAHIASWSPGAALAAAKWLDMTADHMDPELALDGGCSDCEVDGAMEFAREYLGEA